MVTIVRFAIALVASLTFVGLATAQSQIITQGQKPSFHASCNEVKNELTCTVETLRFEGVDDLGTLIWLTRPDLAGCQLSLWRSPPSIGNNSLDHGLMTCGQKKWEVSHKTADTSSNREFMLTMVHLLINVRKAEGTRVPKERVGRIFTYRIGDELLLAQVIPLRCSNEEQSPSCEIVLVNFPDVTGSEGVFSFISGNSSRCNYMVWKDKQSQLGIFDYADKICSVPNPQIHEGNFIPRDDLPDLERVLYLLRRIP